MANPWLTKDKKLVSKTIRNLKITGDFRSSHDCYFAVTLEKIFV